MRIRSTSTSRSSTAKLAAAALISLCLALQATASDSLCRNAFLKLAGGAVNSSLPFEIWPQGSRFFQLEGRDILAATIDGGSDQLSQNEALQLAFRSMVRVEHEYFKRKEDSPFKAPLLGPAGPRTAIRRGLPGSANVILACLQAPRAAREKALSPPDRQRQPGKLASERHA